MAFLSQRGYLFQNANTFLHDRKFDTAIRSSSIIRFIRQKENPSFSDKLIWYHHPNAETYIQDTSLLPQLIVDVLIGANSSRSNSFIDHPRIFSVVQDVTLLQLSHLLSGTDLSNLTHVKTHWKTILDVLTQRHELSRLLTCVVELDNVIELLPDINTYYKEDITEEDRLQRKVSCNQANVKSLNLNLTWSYNMIVFKYGSMHWILPRPVLLELKAKLADIISVLLYSHLGSYGPLDPQAYELTKDFILEYSRLHIKRPSKFFTLAAALEGLVVSIILMRTETWLNDDLWKTLKHEIDTALSIDLEHEPLYHILKQASIPLLAELGCLSKITGHPLVDMLEGSKKLYKRVQENIDVSISAVADCINYIKENYVHNFITRYQRWPKVTFTELAHPLLRNTQAANVSPRSESYIKQFGAITLVDWSSVILEKEMVFDYSENVLSLLADKAISVCRSRTVDTYLKSKQPSRKETRLLLFYLFAGDDMTDHIKYLDKYAQSEGELDLLLDYLVIRVVPKEKELKTAFRGFGCKTFQDRARSIIQGRNTMNYLQLFSDEQALSLDELTLTRKIYSFLKMKELYKDHQVFYINFDASGWNNKFRDKTVGPVVRETIDKVMGTKIWEWTHKAYENTMIIIPDENYSIWWQGQKGGIEGLNQPTWQLVYSGQIKTAFSGTDYKYHLLSKGDDMRAAVPIPKMILDPVDSGTLARELRDKVCKAASDFGHEIKIQESYVSERLFTFSKSMYLDQVPLPYVYRKIQKTHGESNTFLPFLDDYIASTFSNAHSACASSTVHVPQFVIALFWSVSFLIRHPVFSKCSNHELGALCCIPSVVGGLPVIMLNNFLVRAESDLLTSFITLFKYAHSINHPYAILFKRFLEIPVDHQASKSMLLNDPYCLPLFKPRSPIVKLKRLVSRKLRHANIKPEIKELLALTEDVYLKDLVAVLESSEQWWGKLYSALYDSTPMALADRFVSQFISSKSILDTFIASRTTRRRSEKLLKDCMRQDVVLNTWRFNILRGIGSYESRPFLEQLQCPTEISQTLRETMWKTKILTVTHPAMQHQIIITESSYYYKDPTSKNEHFTLTMDKSIKSDLMPNNVHYTKGKFDPFTGHRTSPGTLAPTVKVTESDPTCASILNLVMLHNYTHCASVVKDKYIVSNFPALIEKVLTTLTKLPINTLSPFASIRKSGTQTHRLRSHGFNESIIPNSNTIPYSRCQGETNTHRLFRESSKDYTVNFLHILCHSIIVSQFDTQSQKTTEVPDQVWVVTRNCDYCLTPIDEPLIMLNDNAINTYFPPLIRLARLASSSEPILIRAMEEFQRQHPDILDLVEDQLTMGNAQKGIIYSWIWDIWQKDASIMTRYGLHRGQAHQIRIASGLMGSFSSSNIGETELRLLPPAVVAEALSIFVTSYLIQERYCFDEADVHSSISTMHAEGCPWFQIIVQLSSYNCLSPLLLHLQQETSSQIPLTAVSNYEACNKYITPLLFQLCKDRLITDEKFELPFYNEQSVEYHFNMLKILIPLARYKAAYLLKNNLSSDEDVFNYISLYNSVTAPNVEIDNFATCYDSGIPRHPELVSSERFDPSIDFLAIVRSNHPCYYYLQWAISETGTKLYDALYSLESSQIEELSDDFDTRCLMIQYCPMSLACAVDLVRSQRRGALDLIIDEGGPLMETISLNPKIRLPAYTHIRLEPCNSLTQTKETFPDKDVVDFESNHLNMVYHNFGAVTPISSITLLLFTSLGLGRRQFDSVNSILVINDHEYALTFAMVHLCPNARISVHFPCAELATIPRLLKSNRLPAVYEEAHIHRQTLRSGLTDLTSPVTWNELLEDLPCYPNIILYDMPQTRSIRKIWKELLQLLTIINHKDNKNSIILISWTVDVVKSIGGIINALQYLCFTVDMIKCPADTLHNRVWILCYGHRRTDACIPSNVSTKPSSQTMMALHNLNLSFLSKCASVDVLYYELSTLVDTMIKRMLATCTELKLNIKDKLNYRLAVTSVSLPSENDHKQFLRRIKYIITQELLKKRLSFREGDEGTHVPADTTLRHKIEILRRIIQLELILNNLEIMDNEYGNIMELMNHLTSPEKYWASLKSSHVYQPWIGDDTFHIKRGHYNINVSKTLVQAYECVLSIGGYLYVGLRIQDRPSD